MAEEKKKEKKSIWGPILIFAAFLWLGPSILGWVSDSFMNMAQITQGFMGNMSVALQSLFRTTVRFGITLLLFALLFKYLALGLKVIFSSFKKGGD